jgi:hypothetical protein
MNPISTGVSLWLAGCGDPSAAARLAPELMVVLADDPLDFDAELQPATAAATRPVATIRLTRREVAMSMLVYPLSWLDVDVRRTEGSDSALDGFRAPVALA